MQWLQGTLDASNQSYAFHARSYISGDTMVVDGASWMWDPPLIPREVVTKVSRQAA